MKRKSEIGFVIAFVVLNLVAPLVIGEKFPFTVSPMFCDQPEQYATYQVFDPEGNELDAKAFGLHLVYDGNPPGFGMGIQATSTLHEFGSVVDDETLEGHVRSVLESRPEFSKLPYVNIKRHHVCRGDNCLSRSDVEIRVQREQGP